MASSFFPTREAPSKIVIDFVCLHIFEAAMAAMSPEAPPPIIAKCILFCIHLSPFLYKIPTNSIAHFVIICKDYVYFIIYFMHKNCFVFPKTVDNRFTESIMINDINY